LSTDHWRTGNDSNTERTPIRSEMTARWGGGK
jgi:hypothetical protein